MALFDEILKNPEYQKNLEKLSEDERVEIQKSLRELTEQWERFVLKPIQNLKP